MMQEARLTTLQRKRIADCLQRKGVYGRDPRERLLLVNRCSALPSGGTALPLTFDPPLPAAPQEPETDRGRRRLPPARPQRRGAEACRSGDGYVREKFRPGPTSESPKPWPLRHAAVYDVATCKWRLLLKWALFLLLFFRRLGEREKAASEHYVDGSGGTHARGSGQRSRPRDRGDGQISRRYK